MSKIVESLRLAVIPEVEEPDTDVRVMTVELTPTLVGQIRKMQAAVQDLGLVCCECEVAGTSWHAGHDEDESMLGENIAVACQRLAVGRTTFWFTAETDCDGFCTEGVELTRLNGP